MFLFDEHEELLEETVEPTNLGLDGLEGALIAVSESDNMYFNLCEKMMRLEHAAIVNEDMELLQEGKASFGENVKGLFQKMKSYVEELFRKFMNWITKTLGTDKAILKRLNGKSGTVEIQGYSFNDLDDMGNKISEVANKYLDGDKAGIKPESVTRIMAHKLGFGDVGTIDNSELLKKIKEKIFGGTEKSKQTLSSSEVVSILEDYKKQIKNAQDVKNRLQKSFDNMIKSMGKSDLKGHVERGEDKDGIATYTTKKSDLDKKDLKKYNKQNGATRIKNNRTAASILMKAYGLYIDALKTQRSQARAAASKLMGSSSKESKPEVTKGLPSPLNSESFVGILAEF